MWQRSSKVMQYSSDGAVEDADVVLNNDRLKQVATEL